MYLFKLLWKNNLLNALNVSINVYKLFFRNIHFFAINIRWFSPSIFRWSAPTRVDSPALCDLNENFLTMAREREYKVLSFAETMPTTIGPMIKLLVVPPQSAGEWQSNFDW